jgi:hypothetical protein
MFIVGSHRSWKRSWNSRASPDAGSIRDAIIDLFSARRGWAGCAVANIHSCNRAAAVAGY